MSSWDMGYNSKVLYTYHYFELLNPLWNKFVLTHAGFAVPNFGPNGYACELGFGQGLSINIHALTSDTMWYGNDFNPSHVKFAQDTAAMGPTPNIHLYDDSFEQFAKRDDLPQFDYICMHGIWTWISRENQQYIIDFISKNLKIGGVLYISYNVSPGFELIEPIRYLARKIDTHVLAASSDNDLRIKTIQDIIIRLMKHSPAFLQANPGTAQYAINLLNQPSQYIASEYLCADWDIIHFSDMVENLDRAKMQFACSNGDLYDNLTTDKQKEFLVKNFRNNQTLFEEAHDFIKHTYFRRDLFIKGATKLTPSQQLKQLRQLHFIFGHMGNIDNFDYKIKINDKDVELPHDYSEQVVKFCCDHKVHSYGEVFDYFVGKTFGQTTISVDLIIDLLFKLTSGNVLLPACDPKDINPKILNRVKNYNRQIINTDKENPNKHIASALCQSALIIHESIRAMLAIYLNNPKISKAQLANLMLEQISSLPAEIKNQIQNEESNKNKTIKEITIDSVNLFFEKYIPFLKSLQMI